MSVTTVTSLAPPSGPAGTEVTITGSGFIGATEVGFGAAGATHPTVVSDTQVTAVAPAGGTGTVDVTVSTPIATSATAPADQFTYTPTAQPTPVAPIVTGLTPISGPAGIVVTVIGTGFTGATSVGFGTAGSVPPTVLSDTQLTAISPSAGTGTVNVTVTAPAGTSSPSPAAQFTYTAPPWVSPPAPWPGAIPTPAPAPLTDGQQGYYVDPGLNAHLVDSLVHILRSASSPDALEAQNIILRRIALQGDVIGSRIPPPRNISEIGGYVNLLGTLNQPEMRAQTLAAILGVAGPSEPLGWVSNDQPLAFVSLTNDRPSGRAQAALSLTFLARSDFSAAIQSVVETLHLQGCALPIAGGPAITLPPAHAGSTPPADALPYLGRTLDVAAVTALVDPHTDPLALVRPSGSSAPFAIAATVLSAASPVAPASYDVLVCTATACTPVPVATGRYVPIAPLLASAGFYPPSPLPQPTSQASADWARFTNITGLVPGVTKLGDELALLYNWGSINHSAFASALHWTWNGTAFVP